MAINIRKISHFRIIEFCIILMIWFAVFSLPFFQNRIFGTIIWDKVLDDWILIAALFIVFLLNIYIFVPRLLFPKKYIKYILAVLFSSVIIICSVIWIQKDYRSKNQTEMPPMEIGPGLPPMELGNTMPPPEGFRPNQEAQQKSATRIFFDYMIIAFLAIGAGTTEKTFIRWINEESRRKDIEKEQLKTELALLRHQINPHFLMNTLNNIHALMDINVENAKESVIRLSTLMRYLLYDSSQGKTSLNKELQFIESYFELMQLRYSEKVKIDYQVPDVIPDVPIPPMLFISFIENAFKHGISYRHQSYVLFKLEIQDKKLHCIVLNSKHPGNTTKKTQYSGIGLENIRRNLDLLYKKEYSLAISDKENEFEVNLSIPLYENKMFSH
ncbi:MAG: putative two component system, sensor protein [Bacteroidetes bacterium]|nr:putative two component system, sensor protein [Bacteroidota bacterium]